MKTNKAQQQASFFQKIMTYLIKVQELANKAKLIIILVDIFQFITINTFVILQVFCYYNQKTIEEVLNPFLNIFFNYQNIYLGLIILGAVLAVILLVCLFCFLLFLDVGYMAQTYPFLLKSSVVISAISIGLFQVIFQMMSNNLINVFSSMLGGKSVIDVSIISFFLLNFFMMIFVSFFNSENRIFGVLLVAVNISINAAPLIVTYLVISGLSFLYYKGQGNLFKKILYAQLIITSVWGMIQTIYNIDPDPQTFKTRNIYLCIGSFSSIIIHLVRSIKMYQTSTAKQNKYLVDLYVKKMRKQDKIQDYYDAQIYFNSYLQKSFLEGTPITQDVLTPQNAYNYEKNNVSDWPIEEFFTKLTQKISFDAQKQNNVASVIGSFQLKLDLGIKNISMLKEAFQFISQKQNQNIYIKYLIVKLINKIQSTFCEIKGEKLEKLNQIVFLQKAYDQFYQQYDICLIKLVQFYQKLKQSNGRITKDMQEHFIQFFDHKKQLTHQISLISQKVGLKIEATLIDMLNQVCDPYERKQKIDIISLNKNESELNLPYIILANKNIVYASHKFLQKFRYNKDYIFNEEIAQILPLKFDRYLWAKIKQNEQLNTFNIVLPILNQSGLFNIFNVTFYLLPELKGEINYAMLINEEVVQNQSQNNLILFNCQTFTIQYFNCEIIQNYSLSMQKIRFILDTKTIQFQDIFSSNNPQKQGVIFNKKINKNQENTIKVTFKSSSISQFQKSIQQEVIISIQDTFLAQKVLFKVFKVTSNNPRRKKQLQNNAKTSVQLTQIPVSMKEHYNPKYLKNKYEEQTFFCPIVNPYKQRILHKLQSLKKYRLFNHLNIIRLLLTIIVVIFLGCSIASTIIQKNKKSSIDQLYNQASSLSTQYESMQNALYHVLGLYPLRHYKQSFVSFLVGSFSFNESYAQQIVNQSIAYRLTQKDKSLRRFSQMYFDYPNLPGEVGIPYQIDFGSFKVNTSSQKSTIYDFFIWLVQQNNSQVLKLLCSNYNSLKKIAPFYLPINRYQPKINNLSTKIYVMAGLSSSLSFILMIAIFVLFYQLKDAKNDILSIYLSISHLQIQKIQGKLNTIKQILHILRNNSNSNGQNPLQNKQNNQQSQSFNTFHSINHQKKKGLIGNYNNIPGMRAQRQNSDQNEQQSEQQSELFLAEANKQLKDTIFQEQIEKNSCLGVFFRAILQNVIIFFFFFGILFFAYLFYSATTSNSKNYALAFQYLQKINSINIQYRVQINTFYMFPLYYELNGVNYVDDNPVITTPQKTSLAYQRPSEFGITIDQNLCSKSNTAQVLDPLIAWNNCQKINLQIFQQSFAQSFTVYQLQIRQLSNQTYSNLLTDSSLNQKFFNLFYQYEVYQGYFHNILKGFDQNMQFLHYSIANKANIMLGLIFLFLFVLLVLIYKKSISQLIDQSHLLVILLKMVPEDVLFSMKLASFFKKRSVLQKLDRL